MKRRINVKLLLWTFACVAVVAGAVHVVHGAQMQRQASAIAEQADKAIELKQYAKAIDLYELYLDYRPEDTKAIDRFSMALKQTSAGVRPRLRVFLLLEQAVRHHPDDVEIRKQLVQAAIDAGRMLDANYHLEKLVQANADSAPLAQQLGACQKMVGKPEEAAKSFERAIALAPRQTESYLQLADLLAGQLKQPGDAEKVVNEMVVANGNSWQALLARAKFHFRHALTDLAAAAIAEAYALAPDQIEILQVGAEMALLNGDADRAYAFAQSGLVLDSKNERLYRFLARLESDRRRFDEALQCLQRGLAEIPTSTGLRIDLASLSLELLLSANVNRDAEVAVLLSELRQLEGDAGIYWRTAQAAFAMAKARRGDRSLLPESRRHLLDLRRLHGEIPRALILEAQMDELEGRTKEAITRYVRAIALGQRQPDLVQRVSQSLFDRQRFAEADHVLRQLEELTPLTGGLALLGAEVALQNNDLGRAAMLARKAAMETTSDYRDLLWLGHVLWLTDETKEPTRVLELATRRAPGVPDVWVALVRHLTRTNQPKLLQEVFAEMRERIPADRAELTMAMCLSACGKLSEAEAVYKKMLAESSANPAILRQVAEFYLRTDQLQQAEPLLRRLLPPSTNAGPALSEWARRQLALVLATRGQSSDVEEAISLLYRNVGPTGFTIEDQRLESFVLSHQPGRQAAALRSFQSSFDEQPPTANERFLLARMFAAAGEDSKAIEIMHGLLAMDRDHPAYLAFHIQLLLNCSEAAAVRTYLDLLELLEPGSARTQRFKGQI